MCWHDQRLPAQRDIHDWNCRNAQKSQEKPEEEAGRLLMCSNKREEIAACEARQRGKARQVCKTDCKLSDARQPNEAASDSNTNICDSGTASNADIPELTFAG